MTVGALPQTDEESNEIVLQPSDDWDQVDRLDTAQPVPIVSVAHAQDDGSTLPPTAIALFVPGDRGGFTASSSGHGGTDASSSGSTASSIVSRLPRRGDVRLFRQLGIAVLLLQVLATIAFGWYAMHIANYGVTFSMSQIFHPWCLFTSFKLAMPYPANSFLYRASLAIFFLLIFTIFLDEERLMGRPMNDYYYLLFPIAVFFSILLGVMEIIAKSFRQVTVEQWQRNAVAFTSLESSFKMFWLMIYLLAASLGGLGGKSRTEIKTATEFLQYDETINYENVTITYLSKKMEASYVIDGYVEHLKAASVGTTAHVFTLLLFVLVSLAHLSFFDILELHVTVAEGFSLVAMLILAIVILVDVGVAPSFHGVYFTTTTAFAIVLLLAIVTVLLNCGLIAHSIQRGTHPYFAKRRRKVDNNQRFRLYPEGLPLSEQDFM